MGEAADLATSRSSKPRWQGRHPGILRRFADDWIRPRWRMIALALCWTVGVAASTAGYPVIIKQ